MLGSIATLRHASSRAIRTLEDSIETAERLAEEMDITRSGSDADDDTDEEAAQEFSPHAARDRLAEVYRPLMPGRQMSGLSNRTTRTERSRRARERSAQDEQRAEMKEVRKLEIFLSYTCFLILGESFMRREGPTADPIVQDRPFSYHGIVRSSRLRTSRRGSQALLSKHPSSLGSP